MQFTQIPNQHAPMGGQLRYAFETGVGKKTVEVTVRDAAKDAVFGRKRFVEVAAAQFDIAPYVRREVRFEPRAARTGVYVPDGRVVEVVVEAVGDGDDAELSRLGGGVESSRKLSGVGEGTQIEKVSAKALLEKGVSEARVFLPGLFAVPAPALLTEMPRQRLIGPDQADELTLLVDAKGEVVVTAEVGGEQVVAQYALSEAGVHLFRVDMRDFAGAESVRVDAGACGVVEYTVVKPPQGARRVAWRSRAGSLEHYTFPQEQTTVVESQKGRAYGAGGYVAQAREEWRMELVSAYESRKVLETLSGILSSPQVWLVSVGGYKPVDVLTERSEVYRNGVMSRMELALRPAHKTALPWN